MKILAAGAVALGLITAPAFADEPDGLKLPKGFHATVVAEGLTGMRHIAVRDNGDLYISTRPSRGGPTLGVIALHLNPDGQLVSTEHFSKVEGGTGIRFYKGSLYAASGSGVYKFDFAGDAVVPAAQPTQVVDGLAAGNHPIAFDDKGGLYVSVPGSGNICTDPAAPKGAIPVGLTPCPGLIGRGGIWKFSADKTGQKFADGEQFATGVRDMVALDYRKSDGLYGASQGRNGTNATWPDLVSAEDEKHIADELHRVVKGTNFGWPTT